jgi:hypothetical protein
LKNCLKLEFDVHNCEFGNHFKSVISDCDDEKKTSNFLSSLDKKHQIEEPEMKQIVESVNIEDDRESLDSDDLEFEPFEWTEKNRSQYTPKYILEAAEILSGAALSQERFKNKDLIKFIS